MTYQGFKNYTTWLVHDWLNHSEASLNQLRVLSSEAGKSVMGLASEIEALITDFDNPLSGQNSLYTDILKSAWDEVDWEEIAAAFLKENR
jgi:hypothetical protein